MLVLSQHEILIFLYFKGYGVVYKIDRDGTKTNLRAFGEDQWGAGPSGNIILDSDGSLYGTTGWAGHDGLGVIYHLTPGTKGYQLRVLHAFTSKEGQTFAGLTLSQGMLYGTLPANPGFHCSGLLYSLSKNPLGKWTDPKLHKFCRKIDGTNPLLNPLLLPDGTFYGTTNHAIYKLTPVGDGTYTTTPTWIDGSPSTGAMTIGPDGMLYWTTQVGGNGNGTVFALTP